MKILQSYVIFLKKSGMILFRPKKMGKGLYGVEDGPDDLPHLLVGEVEIDRQRDLARVIVVGDGVV